MPAYRERIYICPDLSGQPVTIENFPAWWDRTAFFNLYRERMIDTGHPVYVNYALLLHGAEALGWDERSREAFAQDPRSEEPMMMEAMRRLAPLFKSASWVIVESYEWESGLE